MAEEMPNEIEDIFRQRKINKVANSWGVTLEKYAGMVDTALLYHKTTFSVLPFHDLQGFQNDKIITCPAPKVIEFIEPGKEKAQMKVRRMQLKKKSPRKLSEDFDFRAIAREVTEFGMTGFSRSERKNYEDQKALALGGKAPKGQKMPYPMLMRRIKRRKEHEREQREGENACNFVAKKSRRRKAAPPMTFKGRWVDNSAKRFDASIGKFKAGVQCLSKADLGRIKGTKQ